MAEEDVDWGMDDDFDPWQPAEEQAVVSHSAALPSVGANDGNSEYWLVHISICHRSDA
jgi:hypothetical protein